MVSVEKITVEFGGFRLLDEVSFVINPKDRIALTGRNGAGKSTLLKIIAGRQQPTSGTVSMPRGFTVGYLPQILETVDRYTVFQEVEQAFAGLFRLQAQIASIGQELSDRNDYDSPDYQSLIDHLNQLNDQLLMAGINDYRAEIEKTLLGLGFERSDFDRPTGEFSGGWRMRIELAKVLLHKPDILLLDEPTNHLDIESIQWFENFLIQNARAVLLVSHDKAFLDNVCPRTAEISLGKLYDYKVSYSQFVALRRERREQQLRTYENQQKMIQDTEAFIERFRYKATKAVQVQSRIKQLEKLQRIEIDEEDTSVMNLRFPKAPHSGSYPVIIENLKKAYGDHTVIQEVNMTVRRGEKVAFVGRNGEGKSTLVRCILGEIPYEGRLQLGHQVKIAYYAQNQPLLLDENLTVLETIDRVAVGDIRTRIRDILGAFMFGGEASDKKVKVLSGGERSRLAMIRLLLEPANLLILDEPTNHLDIRSKEVLKQAIQEFDGTVIIVSHDRDFLDGLVEKVYEFGHGHVCEHLGGIREFLERKQMDSLREIERRGKMTVATTVAASDNSRGNPSESQQLSKDEPAKPMTVMSYQERKEYQKQLRKLQQQLTKTEEEVAACEEALAQCEALLNTPDGAADAGLHEQYATRRKALDTAMSYWEQAASQLDSFSQRHISS
ncbi:MAG: ABC-F family ATP-binding cassette domain-containing protein [Bacteroidales bacterium]|nr:ABC-F family ATP-binding cassette domain-containing protein [Bacteroidales bacterium]